MAKTRTAVVRLQVPAGSAQPGPPVGPALGSRGVNSMEFCKAFNARTADLPGIDKGMPLSVVIEIFSDKSFTFIVRTPPTSVLIKKIGAVSKGSSQPNKTKVGKLTRAQLETIAKIKQPDLSASDLEAAIRTIAGSARSMGVDTEGVI